MGPKIDPCGTPWVTVSGSDSDVVICCPLQCHFRVDSCVIFRSNYFASCIRLLELLAIVGSNMLFGIFSFNNYLHILFGNPTEAYKP